jgi:ribosome assembly protein YihI (activator of Der GTPase)
LCAVKRHIPFEITKEEAWNLFEQQSRKCALTGIELTMYKWEDRKNIGNASLDRIDSNRSYTVENVQWIDKCLQPIKLNWEQSEFIQTCKDVARHAEEKNIGRIFPNLLSEEKSEEKFEFKGNKHAQWKGCGEIGQTTWYRIKQNAQRREIELSIAIDYVWDIFLKQNRKCALTGKILRMRYYKGRKEYGNASLDRIDSSKGYVNGNVQWIDKKLQHIKRNLTDAEFIAICKKVAAYQIEKLGIPSFKQWAKKTVQKGSS